jgi:hypothetical protein
MTAAVLLHSFVPSYLHYSRQGLEACFISASVCSSSFHKHSGRSQAQILRHGIALPVPWQAYTKTFALLSSHPCAHRSQSPRTPDMSMAGRQRPIVHVLGADERGVRGLQQGI